MWPCVQYRGDSEVTSGVTVRVFLGILLVACGTSAWPVERLTDVFEPEVTPTGAVSVVYTNASRMVINRESRIRYLNILQAPRLREISGTQHLDGLLIGGCLLGRLEEQLAQLRAISNLRLVFCTMSGTLDLSLLFLTPFLTSLSLERNRFERVVLTPHPANQSTPLEFLDLSSNDLEHFDLRVMEPFTTVVEIVLSRNRLLSFVGEVQLPKLAILNLQSNRLTQVDLRGCDFQALHLIQFSRNSLTSWPMFASSSRDMKIMDLSYNNLGTVNYTALRQYRKLRTLMLQQNALSSLHPSDSSDHNDTTILVELPMLESLFLNENRLEALDLLVRWQMPLLGLIRVDMNPLKYIPADLFQRCPKLNHFHCYCPNIDCEWIEPHKTHIPDRVVENDQVRPNTTNRECLSTPRVDCVYCYPR